MSALWENHQSQWGTSYIKLQGQSHRNVFQLSWHAKDPIRGRELDIKMMCTRKGTKTHGRSDLSSQGTSCSALPASPCSPSPIIKGDLHYKERIFAMEVLKKRAPVWVQRRNSRSLQLEKPPVFSLVLLLFILMSPLSPKSLSEMLNCVKMAKRPTHS